MDSTVCIRVLASDDGEASEWATSPDTVHIHDYRFDDYDTEVVSLEAAYEHRGVIRDLDWEKTHRTWTGEAWKVDFEALELVVQHLVENGISLTIEPSVLRIFIADFDAPFLNALVPTDPPPDIREDINEQLRLSDFFSEQDST